MQPAFHPGVRRRLTRAEKVIKEREKKRKIAPKTSGGPIRLWRILPCSFEYQFMIDILPGNSFIQKIISLRESSKFLNPQPCPLFPNYSQSSSFAEETKEKHRICKKFLYQNQDLRWRFKRVITKWRISRFRVINDTDFVSLNTIEKPLRIIHFPERCIYQFDAHSLVQHIHKRLLQHDGQIPTPLIPMNPYTNEAFTLAQLIDIYQKTKREGKSIWSFEAFWKCKANIDTFLLHFRKPLRLHALKSILYNYDDWYGKDLLINFMEVHHEECDAPFLKNLYSYCLKELPGDPKIQAWRSLCREYNEMEILAEDSLEREDAFYRIHEKVKHLCTIPNDLMAKRTFLVQQKRNARSSLRV